MNWLLFVRGAWLAYQAYKAVKRTGSRKGYGVGRARHHQARARRRLRRQFR
jgi:hypothetical protein